MDILIKGMELPKDEYVDVRIFIDGRVIANQADANEPNSHYATFTAIAVPPHGRLIDKDAILKDYDKALYVWQENPEVAHDVLVRIVKEAPTVLEANND